ncbi:MAG: hypothetical protein U0V56_03180 [Actinomycetota bacterium]
MTSVKWLTRIQAVAETFDGYQQWAYRLRQREEDDGVPVTRMEPRALMTARVPGVLRGRAHRRVGAVELEGRAWSRLQVVRVDVSPDGGRTWSAAARTNPWDHSPGGAGPGPGPGEHELVVRAIDEHGRSQPLEERWNHHGLANNLVQRVPVTGRDSGLGQTTERQPRAAPRSTGRRRPRC